jgi:hypothetical protein
MHVLWKTPKYVYKMIYLVRLIRNTQIFPILNVKICINSVAIDIGRRYSSRVRSCQFPLVIRPVVLWPLPLFSMNVKILTSRHFISLLRCSVYEILLARLICELSVMRGTFDIYRSLCYQHEL